ncbi:MAG: hypothetical protein KFB96_06345 [Thiocapsa sp.]|uniref:hypothetical protein n=1 Tax=Thiocapsa sp. TaxID=2024551 RepID=UPI001BD0B565|nr:hypothetical protein [Thiocapsa sp.]QVL50082.1 MAG: hypothetical protein KFB96_06345 [Thiocapsa sp.]
MTLHSLRWREPYWIFFISLVYFALNALRLTRVPRVWQDEVQDVEPAFNLLLGHGLTSAAHPYIGFGDFFSGPPLFFLMLWSWMEVFGFSIESVRWFDVTVAWGSAIALVIAVRRSGLLKEKYSRISFFTVVLMGVALTGVYANTRYDLSAIFVLSIAALFYSHLGRQGKLAAVFACAVILPFANYLALIYFGFLVLTLAFYERSMARDLMLAGIAGAMTGVILLFASFYLMDVLAGFGTSLVHASTNWGSLTTKFTKGMALVWSDRSAFILIAFFIVFFIVGVAVNDRDTRNLVVVGLGFLVLLPPVLYVAVHYTGSYRWMAFFPAFLVALMLVERVPDRFVKPRTYVLALCVILIILPGLPRYVAYAFLEWKELNYDLVEDWVISRVEPSDTILVDAPAYYPGKQAAGFAYVGCGQTRIPAEKRNTISKAFLDLTRRQDPVAELKEHLGGHWVLVDELKLERSAMRLALPPYPKEPYSYHVGYFVPGE